MVTDRAKLMALFRLNRDILIRTFSLITAFTVMTRIGAGFGAVTLAANAVLMNFFMIASFYLDGMATAAEQITGETIGARQRSAFERAVKLTGLWSFGLALASLAFFLIFGNAIIGFITTARRAQRCRDLPRLRGADGADRSARLSHGRRLHRRDLVIGDAQHDACGARGLSRQRGRARAVVFQPRALDRTQRVFGLRGLLLLARLKPKTDQTFTDSQ